MYYIPRGGNRGGADQFTWSSVKTDKDREYYLGHSLKAPVGRWQDGRDLQWFNKTRQDGDNMADERRAIKQAEEEAMMAALGQKVIKSPSSAASSNQMSMNPALSTSSGKGREDRPKKRSKRSHNGKSKKKRKKEKAKKAKKKSRSHKRSHRHSSSDSSTESSSSDSSSSDESEEEITKHRRKHRRRDSDEDETWKNEKSRHAKKHGDIQKADRMIKHHDASAYDRGSHRHSDIPPEKHRDRDNNRQRGFEDSQSEKRRPADYSHRAKRDTDSSYHSRDKRKHSSRR